MGENGPQSPREGALLGQVGEGLTGVLEGGWPVGRRCERTVAGIARGGEEPLHGS